MKKSFDIQVAEAVTALAAALVRQPEIDGQKLYADYLDILEGFCQGPEQVGEVAKGVAVIMNAFLQSDDDMSPPV